MNWRRKAAIQRLIAKLPANLSYRLYYFAQRHFGSLRNPNPMDRFRAGLGVMDRIQQQGRPIQSATFLEVGTGRRLNLPIALWLGGAARVVTVDLNPYLAPELIFADLSFVKQNEPAVRELFGAYARQIGFDERLEKLLSVEPGRLDRLLQLLNLDYLAPADAARVKLDSGSIDYHLSYTVLEHIPPAILRDILAEGRRLLKTDGLLVHRVDFSDHFSHSDRTISAINFLRFSEPDWERWSGNRYMYHNRLRIDEFLELLESAGLKLLAAETTIDPRALEELRRGFPLDQRFQGKPPETVATTHAWIVASPNPAAVGGPA